ncbi:MAG TPA: GNAT family N-acetyltransferase [Vitreimonas sp.]|uniref:GNAT family N-acetyltransferase n=1 Tax=Vitreimonas sp. TaxID=3069702 RepID=UPI002D597D74|nr:GNAT family N-acetyltransferase [Vitreimonas sp.]HYD87526.1 GNAT family N-acetyltransferase [Vitreimonas sp.]
MSAPPVRPAHADETDAIAAVLSDAFVDEDGLNYWLRQGRAKERARRRFFDAAVRDAIHPQRQLWLADGEGAPLGAAIWLAPGKKAFDHTALQQVMMLPLLIEIAGFAGMERGRALGGKLARYHPREPHAHLVFLGVAPHAQGRGVGSAMLKATLAPCDAQGVTAYLETSTQRNVDLYARHGFEVTGEFDLPGLHFWTMTRRPRA